MTELAPAVIAVISAVIITISVCRVLIFRARVQGYRYGYANASYWGAVDKLELLDAIQRQARAAGINEPHFAKALEEEIAEARELERFKR